MIKQDHRGEAYAPLLKKFHVNLLPKSYLEIGTESGRTLEIATCSSIAIDPVFQLHSGDVIGKKPFCNLYQMTSDDFYTSYRPDVIFGRPVDLAFLDGMHRCEFLLRDFSNTERFCKRNSVVLLHDCVPVEEPMTSRIQGVGKASAPNRKHWWTGDVWRTAQALRRFRPDLSITAYDAQPTGLIAITNLDPDSTLLSVRYHEIVQEMMSWELHLDSYYTEMDLQSTSTIDSQDKMNVRFWL